MKPIVLMIILAALIVPAEAKKKKGGGGKGDPKQAEKAKKDAEKDRKRKGVDDFLAQKDKNSDRIVTKPEYLDGVADAEAAGKKFDQFNKNKDRALSKSEIEALLGL